ncbi:NAD(P)-dependent oxidoreductase [Vineibacter terrae]|uniref:NAD(P)-dependent oxidoreductase n=1 Tax=Vineibacter terrae TaxID=2586908 RepID=A0A5C8PNN3_9HYPH|nr:NAD(P)-dependent oxidoreductase [Vineibacter terrae]TXL75925.1 NAD(P)-dependent oxidoreductase [Vineibacter terrae]
MPAPLTPPATIAFIGLGMMGKPMAARLVAAGYSLRVHDASQQAMSDFVGAHPAALATASARAAASGADAVITMLPDGKIVRAAVLDGAEAAADGLAPGTIVIDMSSSAPTGTRTLGSDLAARSLRCVDAPVSGGVRRAIDGSLAIMAGGAAEDVEQCRPLLLAMGKSVFHTGAIGSGHALKALNNYLSATSLLSMCEALIVGEAFGLDPAVMADVFNASSGMSNSTQVKAKPFVIPRNYTAGFAMGLMSKDLRTAADLADQIGVRADTLQAMADIWAEAMAKLGKDADHTAIHRFLAER